MKVRVQIIVEADDDSPPTVHEVARVERNDLHVDTLGLHLTEAKDLLQKVQEVVVAKQVQRYLDEQAACLACGRPRRHKDATTIFLRTLFGTVHLRSPRWWHCVCRPQPTRTFQSARGSLARAHHARAALSGDQVFGVDLVRPERQPAGRDAPAGT